MGAGRYDGDPTGDPAGLPCDPEHWSAESQRSVAYWFRPPEPYRDKAYRCWRCDRPSVFSAADQRYTFEVRKARIDQQRVLCPGCHRQRCRLERVAGECRRRWSADRASLRRDREFLLLWLAAVEALPRYQARPDTAHLRMLRRLAAEAADQTVDPPTPGWRTETVVALASAIRTDRALDRLPILADALEEAGFDRADVLSNCRDPHLPPALGDWVVDLVLGPG